MDVYYSPKILFDELFANESSITTPVIHYQAVENLSTVVGWIYFVAWSISFYPQIYINYTRKSVVGLSFDFLGLNLTGFLFYLTFNVCLYAVPSFQEAYRARFGADKAIPVALNDIFFAGHAVLITIVTIVQCFVYERGEQKVAYWVIAFLVVAWESAIILLIFVLSDRFSKLDFVYYLSYVKLCITIIKYIPQAWYNYRRKSTVGWSIGNILLDFTGGSLSIVQMFLDAYNHDDWKNIFGNPTKFGLGLFSVLFDILFIIQHYILYRNASHDDQASLTNSRVGESCIVVESNDEPQTIH